MKPHIFKVFFAMFASVALLGGATVAQASSLSSAQVQAVVSLLQSFGADQSTINSVAASLGGTVTPTSWCPSLSYNLYIGLTDSVTGGQVSQLQRYLNLTPTGYFGTLTRQAVAQFQQQQGVFPVTGGVGPLTRQRIALVCNGTPTPTPAPVSVSYIAPTQGAVGSQVTIYGTGFTNDNTIHFGWGGTQHVQSFNNGTVINYTIPQSVGPCDLVTPSQQVCAAALQLVTPGTYYLSVANANGQSGQVTYTITAQASSGITVQSPVSGAMFTRGQDLPILWSVGSSIPTSASVTLDLYTQAGVDVGTIAIVQGGSTSYTWHIPGFPQNYMCTMQYPNGLCGTTIPTGQYYIKATARADGFDPNAAVYGSGTSGLFTISLP